MRPRATPTRGFAAESALVPLRSKVNHQRELGGEYPPLTVEREIAAFHFGDADVLPPVKVKVEVMWVLVGGNLFQMIGHNTAMIADLSFRGEHGMVLLTGRRVGRSGLRRMGFPKPALPRPRGTSAAAPGHRLPHLQRRWATRAHVLIIGTPPIAVRWMGHPANLVFVIRDSCTARAHDVIAQYRTFLLCGLRLGAADHGRERGIFEILNGQGFPIHIGQGFPIHNGQGSRNVAWRAHGALGWSWSAETSIA